jgi:hypothetical protein
MDNVQNCDSYTDAPSSPTYRYQNIGSLSLVLQEFLPHVDIFRIFLLTHNAEVHRICMDNLCNSVQIMLRFEVFTAVTMKNSVFWDVTYFFAACVGC